MFYQDADRLKRYRYLLGQTELFAHFFNLKVEQDEELRRVMEETNNTSKLPDEDGYVMHQPSLSFRIKLKPPVSSSRRRRKTEKEEDEEILKDEDEEGTDLPTVFTESPKCTCNISIKTCEIGQLINFSTLQMSLEERFEIIKFKV